jgi:putative transposase
VYHAVSRGNRGSRIFRDDPDYLEYLKLLARSVERFGWYILAYCLMGNHVHLVVETPQPNLPAGMQWLHGNYGRYFNDRHDLFGHVFQGRYKSIRQATDEQLWHVLRYVALNPVEAGLCKHPRDYPWSSYGKTPVAPFVAIDRLSWFAGEPDGDQPLDHHRRLVEEHRR